jgi:CBS-domain-containing membrane protein
MSKDTLPGGIDKHGRIDLDKVMVRNVARIFRPEKLKVRGDAPLNRLVKLLLDHKENHNIYVLDDVGCLIGIISFHELLKVFWAKIGLMDKEIFDHMEFIHYTYSTTADDIMAPAVSVTDDDSLLTAIRLMEKNKLRDLPVVDKEGRVIEEVNSTELLAFGRNMLKERMKKEEAGEEWEKKKKKE